MQKSELKSVNITIAGRTFPLKVTSDEEKFAFNLEKELNEKITEFQNTYVSRDKLDCVIMTLLTYTFDKSNNDNNDQQLDTELINKKIHDITDLVSAFED